MKGQSILIGMSSQIYCNNSFLGRQKSISFLHYFDANKRRFERLFERRVEANGNIK